MASRWKDSQFISGNFENELEHSVLSQLLDKDFLIFRWRKSFRKYSLIFTPDHLLPNNIGQEIHLELVKKKDLYILLIKIISNKKNNSQLGLSKILLDTAEVDPT